MSVYRALRRRILTPNISETTMEVRGFHVKSAEGRNLLETVGASFLTGYAYAAEAATTQEAEERLETIPVRFRGFAYEGAAMGFAVREGMPIPAKGLVADFLNGRGDDHIYMVYVGVGWAMARLPKFRWSTLYAPDPLLRWLVLDGYGFHQCYFKTDAYAHAQYRDPNFSWPGGKFNWYANNAIDQGIGRAMWFVCGTDAERVAKKLLTFAEDRRPDLFAGAGLAATYAGGGSEDELRTLWDLGAEYRTWIAQGAAFAAAARVRAGLVVSHNEVATKILCGLSVEDATMATATALMGAEDEGDLPAYEVWRRRIAASFEDHARS